MNNTTSEIFEIEYKNNFYEIQVTIYWIREGDDIHEDWPAYGGLDIDSLCVIYHSGDISLDIIKDLDLEPNKMFEEYIIHTVQDKCQNEDFLPPNKF